MLKYFNGTMISISFIPFLDLFGSASVFPVNFGVNVNDRRMWYVFIVVGRFDLQTPG